MPITKRTEVDQTTIDAHGNVHIRTATVIEEDGVEISRTFHREVLEPGDSTAGKSADIVAITNAVWSPQKVAKAAARKAARQAERGG